MATTKHMESSVDSKGKTREVEVFVFHNPAKRKLKEKDVTKPSTTVSGKGKAPVPKKSKTNDALKIDLEIARKEVRDFGISGFRGQRKIEAQLSQLKSLGAQIPKNWERKMAKKQHNREVHRRQLDMKQGIKHKKMSNPKKAEQRSKDDKSKKEEKSLFDGKAGKYKDGVQYISSADIQKVRKSVKNNKK